MNEGMIGNLIERRRKVLAINQQDLAETCGISVHSLSDIETGRGNPTLDTLTRIASALGLELSLRVKEL